MNIKSLSTLALVWALGTCNSYADQLVQDTKQAAYEVLEPRLHATIDTKNLFYKNNLKPHTTELVDGAEVWFIAPVLANEKKMMLVQGGNYDAKLHRNLSKYTYDGAAMIQYDKLSDLSRHLPSSDFSVYPIHE